MYSTNLASSPNPEAHLPLSIEKQHGQHELALIEAKGCIFPASSTIWHLQFNERSPDVRPAST
jgi:hypothetical protein